MSNFVGTSPFLETMHFHIAQTGSFLELYFAFRGSCIDYIYIFRVSNTMLGGEKT